MGFGALLALIAAGFAIAAVVGARSPAGGQRSLARFAERAGLPVPMTSVRALEDSMRRRRTTESAAIAGAAGLSGVLLLTPLGLSPMFPLAVFLPVLLVTTLVTTTSAALHERLSAPSLGMPRVARSRRTTVRDYLAAVPRTLTWVLAAGAAVGGVWVLWELVRGGVARPSLAALAIVVAALALVTSIVLPLLEGRILARPQPVGSELELAWDDALRLAALNGCRQSAAILSIAAVALAVAVAFSGDDNVAGWCFTISVMAQLPLSAVYPAAGAFLPHRLYPHGIHVPVGSTA